MNDSERDSQEEAQLTEATKFKLKTVTLGTVTQTEDEEGLTRLTRGFSALGPFDIFNFSSNDPSKPWLF